MFLLQLARNIGFEAYCELSVNTLSPLQAVREMCAQGHCRLYGKRWSCPPACGSLEKCRERISRYNSGILVQTVGILEDDFDLAGIRQANEEHTRRFQTLARQTRTLLPECLPLTAGGCSRCAACTYPSRPCRFPGKMLSSMEAYGLYVAGECKKAGLEYNYGSGSLTYSSCILY